MTIAEAKLIAMQTTAESPPGPATTRATPAVPELARQIMEASIDAVLLVDSSLRIVAWNSAAASTFGWSAAEAVGREIADLIPERLRGTYRMGLTAAMDPASDLPLLRDTIETVGIRADGQEFPARLSLRLIGSGGDALFIACVRDIADRQQVSAAAAAAGESHARFVANMSHELRTPLNSVLGFAQLLNRDAELSERHRRYVGHIMEGGSNLLGVIDDILDLDRIGAGKAELRFESLPLRPLLEAVVALQAARAATSGVRVYLAIAGALELDSDHRRLGQIVTNLLSNAIKFTPDGGQVTIAAQALDGKLRLEVTDTGVGIPLGDQERIFDPFAQVDSRLSRRHAGTGLGLSLSRRLATILGGELSVSSVVGSGSNFRLVLPLARGA